MDLTHHSQVNFRRHLHQDALYLSQSTVCLPTVAGTLRPVLRKTQGQALAKDGASSDFVAQQPWPSNFGSETPALLIFRDKNLHNSIIGSLQLPAPQLLSIIPLDQIIVPGNRRRMFRSHFLIATTFQDCDVRCCFSTISGLSMLFFGRRLFCFSYS